MGIACISHKHSLALITGASSGIGCELAYLLADKGISLILVARNTERLEEVANICRKKVATSVILADIAKPIELQKVLAVIDKECPDLVINNAGVGLYGDLIEANIDESLKIVQTNCESVVAISQRAAATLVEKKRAGTIMNISSVLAFFPSPGSSVYAASKCFVMHFSKALDTELAPNNIRVLCAFPGQVATRFFATASGRQVPNKRGFFVLDAKNVAKKIYRQIQKQKKCSIIDFRYKILVGLCKLLPESFVKRKLLVAMRKRTQK